MKDQYYASRERKITLLCAFHSPQKGERWSLVSDPENTQTPVFHGNALIPRYLATEQDQLES